jgi:hypothetical protein
MSPFDQANGGNVLIPPAGTAAVGRVTDLGPGAECPAP